MFAHSNGMWPLAFGKPDVASVMQAMPFVVWLRPVSRHERVGEHSAVVWKFVYVQAPLGDPLDVRRLDQAAVGLHRREADVVEHDVEDVRRALRARSAGCTAPSRASSP